MELFNSKLSTIATGATYKNSDYSQADADRAQQITVGMVEPTFSDYEKLDVSGDGRISILDCSWIAQIVEGTRTVDFTTAWKLRIDPTDGENLLKIYRVYHNNITGADTENIVLSAGFANVKANSVEAVNLTAEKEIKAKSAIFDDLKVNGETYQPFEKKPIGYVVCCTGGSNNQATCFIPAGTSGAFQCASNDWYCAFSFDGSGGASKTGGSGTVDSVKTVYNG